MPNHVHVLLRPNTALPIITRWLKGSTARTANRILGRTGEAFWQDESFDHRVQGAEQTGRIVRYIEWNPVSAGFVAKATDWPWSSAGWQAKASAPLPSKCRNSRGERSSLKTKLAIPFRTMHNHERDMAEESPQLLPGTLYMLILRTLASEPKHGYAIAQRIKQCSAEVLAVEEGSLYPALNRMLIKGWLKAEWGTSETGRKARFYRLTDEGRRQLASESGEFNRLVKAIQLVMKTA